MLHHLNSVVNIFWIYINRIPNAVLTVLHKHTFIPLIYNEAKAAFLKLEETVDYFEKSWDDGFIDVNDNFSMLHTLYQLLENAGVEALDVAILGLLLMMSVIVLLYSKRQRAGVGVVFDAE